jgi:hypothetical protein
METNTFHLPPFFIEVDGCPVEVVEVVMNQLVTGETYFRIVLSIIYKGIQSRTYSLVARDTEDLVNKLKIEISKIKFAEYSKGLNEVKRMIS